MKVENRLTEVKIENRLTEFGSIEDRVVISCKKLTFSEKNSVSCG